VEINRKDILLILLYVPGIRGQCGEPIKGITRLTKLLFLLNQIYKIDSYVGKYYSFEAHNYGPFTREIYDDLDFFDDLGFVEKKGEDSIQREEYYILEEIFEDLLSFKEETELLHQDSYKEIEFRLTARGRTFVEKMINQVPLIEKACIEVKKRFGSIPLTSLLRYVYKKYPNMAKESVRKDLLGVE